MLNLKDNTDFIPVYPSKETRTWFRSWHNFSKCSTVSRLDIKTSTVVFHRRGQDLNQDQPTTGAVKATWVDVVAARSSGKLWAFLSWTTSIPKLARFRMSAQVGITLPCESMMLELKLNPFRLNAMELTPRAANQIPTTGQAARKK